MKPQDVSGWLAFTVLYVPMLAFVVGVMWLFVRRIRQDRPVGTILKIGIVMAFFLIFPCIFLPISLFIDSPKPDPVAQQWENISDYKSFLTSIEIKGTYPEPDKYRARNVVLVNRNVPKGHEEHLSELARKIHSELHPKIRAAQVQKAQTIVWLEWKAQPAGQYYQERTILSDKPTQLYGYVLTCEATMIDRATGMKVASKTFTGNPPVKEINRVGGGAGKGAVYGEFDAHPLLIWIYRRDK